MRKEAMLEEKRRMVRASGGEGGFADVETGKRKENVLR